MPREVPLETDCQSVAERLDSDSPLVLIDCREPDEHATARIAAARLVPMSELTARLDELAAFRERPLVIHCHHGGRSLKVARWLREQGFSQAQSMSGGIDQWSQTIDPAVPRY
jgi:rhodanese-related sulfurtransferase